MKAKSDENQTPTASKTKPRKQVAALPLAVYDGEFRILVITSRETRRFVVPKGWSIPGLADHKAAEIEAREEAGLLGSARHRPLGSYLAWKKLPAQLQLVRVKVFLFRVSGQLENWKEKGEREMSWLRLQDAATLFDEPGLAEIVASLPARLPKPWRIDTSFRIETLPRRLGGDVVTQSPD